MKWYVKSSLGYYWMGPAFGWGVQLTKGVSRFDTPNDAMTDLLSMRHKHNGQPIVFTCGIEILQETN